MFTQLRNIDAAFTHVKRFSIAFLSLCLLLTCGVLWFCFSQMSKANDRVLILYNGKVLEAFASSRRQNIAVELRDHIKTFHQHFFNLDPDEQAIEAGIGRALYLADGSARKAWENLKEAGYYNNLISANISQQIEVDSIHLDLDVLPYAFTCFATQELLRSSSVLRRRLVTRGTLRVLQSQTDHNPHGFLIQHWETVLNEDMDLKGTTR